MSTSTSTSTSLTTPEAERPAETPLPRSLQCGYRSKRCEEPRATKLDGSPHQLCEFHRRKANSNQKRLHQRQKLLGKKKKRALRSENDGANVCDGEMQTQEESPVSGTKRARVCVGSPQSTSEPVGGNTFETFAQEDLEILNGLLFDPASSLESSALVQSPSAWDLSSSPSAWDWSASMKPEPPTTTDVVAATAVDTTISTQRLAGWTNSGDFYTIIL